MLGLALLPRSRSFQGMLLFLLLALDLLTNLPLRFSLAEAPL